MRLNRIKNIHDHKGESQTWLAKQVDKSCSTICYYTNNICLQNFATFLAMYKIYKVDLKNLITEEQ